MATLKANGKTVIEMVLRDNMPSGETIYSTIRLMESNKVLRKQVYRAVDGTLNTTGWKLVDGLSWLGSAEKIQPYFLNKFSGMGYQVVK